MIRHLIRSSSRPMAGSAPILPMDPHEARALAELRRRRAERARTQSTSKGTPHDHR